MTTTASADDILAFWFEEVQPRQWFAKDARLDALIRRRFEATWEAGRAGELEHWRTDPAGALALVVLFDQFPLNMYRGQAKSFATEGRAREVAAFAIEQGWDRALAPAQKAFLYMPFMHSEKLADQDRAVALFEAAGLKDNLRFARHHREIIRRFGRFPHRNAILGRRNTPEEQAWLASDQAFLG